MSQRDRDADRLPLPLFGRVFPRASFAANTTGCNTANDRNPTDGPHSQKKRVRIRRRRRARRHDGVDDDEMEGSATHVPPVGKPKQHDVPMTRRDLYFCLRCSFIPVAVVAIPALNMSDAESQRCYAQSRPLPIQEVVARVCLINWNNMVVLDSYVKPQPLPFVQMNQRSSCESEVDAAASLFAVAEVLDYQTEQTGLAARHFENESRLQTMAQVRQQLRRQIKGRILIGHSLSSQLDALGLTHPWCDTRDAANYIPFMSQQAASSAPSGMAVQWVPVELRALLKSVLGWKTVTGGLIGEAIGCMDLYKRNREDWESDLSQQLAYRLPDRQYEPSASQVMENQPFHPVYFDSRSTVLNRQTRYPFHNENQAGRLCPSPLPLPPHLSDTSTVSSMIQTQIDQTSGRAHVTTTSRPDPIIPNGAFLPIAMGKAIAMSDTMPIARSSREVDIWKHDHAPQSLQYVEGSSLCSVETPEPMDGDGWKHDKVAGRAGPIRDESIRRDFVDGQLQELSQHLPSDLLDDDSGLPQRPYEHVAVDGYAQTLHAASQIGAARQAPSLVPDSASPTTKKHLSPGIRTLGGWSGQKDVLLRLRHLPAGQLERLEDDQSDADHHILPNDVKDSDDSIRALKSDASGSQGLVRYGAHPQTALEGQCLYDSSKYGVSARFKSQQGFDYIPSCDRLEKEDDSPADAPTLTHSLSRLTLMHDTSLKAHREEENEL